MSLLNKASLIQIPSGYKDGTLYSAKPTNGDGDFTFSRGSNLAATRVNSEGLIEKGRENLLLQSNSFDTTWSLVNASVTSGQSGYDGSSDAWLLTKTSGTGSTASVRQTISLSGSQTFSVYAKAGSLDWMALIVIGGSNPQAYFNVSNGTLGSTGNGAISSFITDAGNGWYRCSIVLNESVTQLRIYTANDDNVANGAAGNIYIQDAQLEQGLVATDYIETTTTTAQAGILEDMPRLDYSGGASCPSLLLEPQRSNLYTNSEYSGVWNKTNWTTTDNYAISPEGVQNAFRAVSSNTSGILYISGSGVTGQDNTLSVWAKSNTGGNQKFRFFANGNTTTSSDFTATTEWQRFEYTYNCTAVTSGIKGASSELSDILFYGFQHEEGSYPTSYIPTYGAISTRSQDVCSKTGISSLIGTDFTLFYDGFETTGGQSTRYIILKGSGGTYANSVFLEGSSNNRIALTILDNGSTSVFSAFSPSLTNGQRIKLAVRCKNNDFAFYVNGSLVKSQLSGSVPTTSDLYLGYYTDYSDSFSLANQAIIFSTALTNDELASLTTL